MATTRKSSRDASKETESAKRDDAIRKEYRSAGELDGMVGAWVLARKVRVHYDTLIDSITREGKRADFTRAERRGARLCELAIARQIRRLWPKAGAAELTAHGWEPAGSGDGGEL